MKISSLKSYKKIVLLLFLIEFIISQVITQVDFKFGASQTGATLWGNYVGVSLEYTNIENHINNTLFQAYQRNAILKGDWSNAWIVSMKVPLGHKFDCANLTANNTETVICNQDTAGNGTYWTQLGLYIRNTVATPYWFMGFDTQGVNFMNPVHNRTYFNWGFNIWNSLGGRYFGVELIDYGNQMVEKGYRTQYSPNHFLYDVQLATNIIRGAPSNGPGITQDAGPEWLLSLQTYNSISPLGRFSIRCTIFPDSSQITIEKILSDNSTKYYLEKRFTINQSYRYSNFINLYTGISDLKLTEQPGVDGVTNVFATTIWALDFMLEFSLLNGFDVSFNHKIFQGNFQSILGTAPGYKPSPIYYAMIFMTLIRQQSPKIIMPSQKVSLSSKIKAFGFTTGDVFKILLINKDTNIHLNGKVNVYARLTGDLTCLNMEAPSLQSKDNITIAGYNFVEGNASVNGTFTRYTVRYDSGINGWKVPMKYAQVIFCTTADKLFEWPMSTSTKMFADRLVQIVTLSVIIIIIFIA